MSQANVEVDGHILSLTNLEKALYPDGFTKGEVLDYYTRVSAAMLPHLRDKVVTRVRFPHGTAAEAFFEKNPPSGAPSWITWQDVQGEDLTHWVTVPSLATLVYLAQIASLEFHIPRWRVHDQQQRDGVIDMSPEVPVRCVVIDLDPGEGTGFAQIQHAALLCAQLLASDGLVPHAMASGGKGIQLYAAHRPTPASAVHAYAHGLARRAAASHPDIFVLAVAKEFRKGKVLFDFRQNEAPRTMICPYSLRGNDSPTVATPVTWEEIATATSIDELRATPSQAISRLSDHGDLLAELLTDSPVSIPDLSAD